MEPTIKCELLLTKTEIAFLIGCFDYIQPLTPPDEKLVAYVQLKLNDSKTELASRQRETKDVE